MCGERREREGDGNASRKELQTLLNTTVHLLFDRIDILGMIHSLLKSRPVCCLCVCVYKHRLQFEWGLFVLSSGAQIVSLSVYRLCPLIQRAPCIVTRRAAVSLRQTHVGGGTSSVYPGTCLSPFPSKTDGGGCEEQVLSVQPWLVN